MVNDDRKIKLPTVVLFRAKTVPFFFLTETAKPKTIEVLIHNKLPQILQSECKVMKIIRYSFFFFFFASIYFTRMAR